MKIILSEQEVAEAVAYYLAKKGGLQRAHVPIDVSFSDTTQVAASAPVGHLQAVVTCESREETTVWEDIFKGGQGDA